MHLTKNTVAPGVQYKITGYLTVFNQVSNIYSYIGDPVSGYFTDAGLLMLQSMPIEQLLQNARVSKNKSNPNRMIRVSAPSGGTTLNVDRLYKSDINNRIIWSSGLFNDIADVQSEGVCTIDGSIATRKLGRAMVYNPHDTMVDGVASSLLASLNVSANCENTPITAEYGLGYSFNNPIIGKVGLFASESDIQPAAILHFNQNALNRVSKNYGDGNYWLNVVVESTIPTDKKFAPFGEWSSDYVSNIVDGISNGGNNIVVFPTNRCWFLSDNAYIEYIYSDAAVSFNSLPDTMTPDSNGGQIESILAHAMPAMANSTIYEDHILLPSISARHNLPLRAFGIVDKSTSKCMWRHIFDTPLDVYGKSFYNYHFNMTYLMSFL